MVCHIVDAWLWTVVMVPIQTHVFDCVVVKNTNEADSMIVGGRKLLKSRIRNQSLVLVMNS